MLRFLRVWLVALVGLVCAILALTVLVDPFGVLDMPRIEGFNAQKPAAADWPRLTKAYMVDAVHPATLVLGSSNTDVGIDPGSASFPASAQPVYNLAIDGAGPGTLLRYLQHAYVRNSPSLVLLGLSFEDAIYFPPRRLSAATQAQFGYEQRLRVAPDGSPNPSHTLAWLADMTFATLSIQALTDSVSTILRQNNTLDTYQTRQGFNTGGKFLRWAQSEGPYALFMDKNRTKAPEFVLWSLHPMLDVQPVGAMIRLAQSHGSTVIVFVIPSHVDELEIQRQIGIEPQVRAWKAALATIVEQAAQPGKPVTLWDFSGFSRYTTEPVPAPGDTATQMQWTWEPIHFKPALGDLMLRRMLSGDGPADLGAPITAASLPARAAAFDAQQREWVATHPADVARIAAVVGAAARQICHTDIASCPRPDPGPTASR